MALYKDEIVDEVRKTRHAYAARFKFDLDKIFKDLKKSEKARCGFKKISLKPSKAVVRRKVSA